jgi:hypothetical protein
VQFAQTRITIAPSQKLPKGGHKRENALRQLKLKLYPVLFAAVGLLAASGGYFRTR